MLRRLVALVGLAVFVVFGLITGLGHTSSEANTPANASAAALASASCDSQFTQTPANNNGDKVDGDFEAKYAAATSGAANLSDAQKQLLLKESANNAQRLAIWSNAFGLYANPNDWHPLVSGNCLSAAGQTLFHQFEGALNAKGTTFAEGDAPANGYNTQVASGTFQVFSTSGVTGNRKAIKVTMANGTVVWIMVRCGNVVYNTPPPGVPPTKPPTTPPTTKPPTTCPPTTCLTPKSTSTSDYRQPGDSGKGADVGTGVKPPVTAATTAQAAPPAVTTTRAVIVAPSAKPPTTTSTTTPPNQGGGGTGVVTGF